MAVYSRLTPLFILTGFLGSGKTTLLNHILKDPSLNDAAVLVNEFGDVGLDHFLVEKMDENTVLLESGCLCCTIRDDLKEAIIDLNSKRERGDVPFYKRIIIETTGLADPSPIIFTLNSDIIIKHHYRLGTIITMVDTLNGSSQLANYSEAKKQVSVADRLIFSKLDITDSAIAEDLKAKVIGLNPTAQLIDAFNGVVDVKSLLDADIYDIRTKGIEVQSWLKEEEKNTSHASHKHDTNRHDEHIETFTVTYKKPLDWTAFGIWLTMLLHAHGERVLRVKGILNVTGVDAPVIINGVQHVVHPPLHLKSWPTKDRRSHIIFIVDDMKKEDIERSLSVFNGISERPS